jgi:hypothetical protein
MMAGVMNGRVQISELTNKRVRNNRRSTLELHLSGLLGTTSHRDMQKIRIIAFYFENRLHFQPEVGKKITCGCFRLRLYLHRNKTIYNFVCVFDKWGKI